MKCQVCKTKEAEPRSTVCSDRCFEIRSMISRLQDKYTPTHGCDNCWGDLHQECTKECKEEFEKSSEFVKELYNLIRL
jgi:hypothetical protein